MKLKMMNLVAVAIFFGSVFTLTVVQASNLTNNTTDVISISLDEINLDGKCGGDEKKVEAKKGEKKADVQSDKKAEHKCGEGKCGGDSKDAKAAKAEKSDVKAEHKCGEGKCGGDSKDAKAAKAEKSEKKAPKTEAKSGEGKCGIQ